MAQQNNEGDGLENLAEGLDEFLQGRYSLTLYCPYNRSHSRIFNAGKVKSCLLYAFFCAVIHQMIGVLLRHDKVLPFHEPETKIGRDGSFQGVLLDMNEPVIINENFANRRENMDNQQETLNNMHGPIHDENEEIADEGDKEVETFILFRMIYGFVRSYVLFLFIIYSVFHLIPALLTIAHDVFVRHVVAKTKKNPMLYGLFRFQRVRTRN